MTRNNNDAIEQKKQNNNHSLEVEGATNGSVSIDYQIQGNEYQAEQLWMAITNKLRELDEEDN